VSSNVPSPTQQQRSTMQEGGKIAVAVSVTFLTGVVTGWLLNTYTRKVCALRV
jgi:hypothetical protein